MMMTMIECYRQGLFHKKHWFNNITAGVIVGIIALPLAMAFAIASGAKPEQGLYTAIVAGFLVSVFGGSRVQISGPTGAFIIILSGIAAKYGLDGLQIATILAGFMLIFLGVARLGMVIKFIPSPVILGFTAGIAISIWVGQWYHFFGLPKPLGLHFHEKIWSLMQSFSHINFITTLIGVLSLLVVVYSSRIPVLKRIPGALIAMIIATILEAIYQFDGVATIGNTYGGIPQGLPTLHWPTITMDRIIELIGPAFTIAMLGAIESLLSAVVADGMSNTRHDSNRELIGQGLANIAAPILGGIAATGAIARTATSIRHGANSPLAGIIHCITLLFIILFLAPLAANIPLACLAAILFVVAWNMSEAKHCIQLIKTAPWMDVSILIITFLLTIFVDLVVAVYIGVILAILHFLLNMASGVEISKQNDALFQKERKRDKNISIPEDVVVYAIDGPFFFGAIEVFESALAYTHNDPRVLIFRLRWVPLIDSTAINALRTVIGDLQSRGVHVLLTGPKPTIMAKLKKAGIIKLLGKNNVFDDFYEALETTLKVSSDDATITIAPDAP